jgi:hypothetical protein
VIAWGGRRSGLVGAHLEGEARGWGSWRDDLRLAGLRARPPVATLRSCTCRRSVRSPRLLGWPATARRPCGTQRAPSTVASSRTWRGSQVSAAQDRTINTAWPRADRTTSDLGQEFDPARADCGFRAPLAPRLARPLEDFTRRGSEAAESRPWAFRLAGSARRRAA